MIDDLNKMFSEAEGDVLIDLFTNGDNTPSNIAENTDNHRKTVQRRLAGLEDRGLVYNKGGGVYRLTPEGFVAARVINQHRSG